MTQVSTPPKATALSDAGQQLDELTHKTDTPSELTPHLPAGPSLLPKRRTLHLNSCALLCQTFVLHQQASN